jgi:endonuclease YncB( thermonuclease family)
MPCRIPKGQKPDLNAASAAVKERSAKQQHRSFRRRTPRFWIAGAIFLALVLVRMGYDHWLGEPRPSAELPLAEGLYDVVRIVDGATLVVRQHSTAERAEPRTAEDVPLRLLGIACPQDDTPDRPEGPWAREASSFTARFVAGQPVHLRLDKRRVDLRGRYLAYVSVGGTMLNEQLLRCGLARVSISPGDSESISRRLRAAEQEARDERRGIWSVKRY